MRERFYTVAGFDGRDMTEQPKQMSVMIENVAPCRRKLRVEIGAERVAGARAEILQEFRRHAEIPGFRPGHAPEPMIEKRFAHAIDDELRKRLFPDSYREAVTTHKLHTIGYPKIESVESNTSSSGWSGNLPKVRASTSGQRLEPPMPSTRICSKPVA